MRTTWIAPPVVALALVVVLLVGGTGGAIGAVLITGADIQDGSVGSVDLRDETLTGVDVKNEGLSGVDVKNETLTGADLRNGTVGADDLKDNVMWAVVSRGGTVLRTNGVVTVDRPGTGVYLVRFARPVSDRGVVATLYSDLGLVPDPGQVLVRYCDGPGGGCAVSAGPEAEWVNVLTLDGDGSDAANRPFVVVATAAVPGTITPPTP